MPAFGERIVARTRRTILPDDSAGRFCGVAA